MNDNFFSPLIGYLQDLLAAKDKVAKGNIRDGVSDALFAINKSNPKTIQPGSGKTTLSKQQLGDLTQRQLDIETNRLILRSRGADAEYLPRQKLGMAAFRIPAAIQQGIQNPDAVIQSGLTTAGNFARDTSNLAKLIGQGLVSARNTGEAALLDAKDFYSGGRPTRLKGEYKPETLYKELK